MAPGLQRLGVLAALTLALLSACAPEPDIELSVYLRPQGASLLTPKGAGTLTLQLDPPREVSIRDGRGRVGGIPAACAGQRVGVQLELSGYRLAEPDATLLVERGGIANLGIVAAPP